MSDEAEQPRWPAPLLRFCRLFNDSLYWESHEALETPWREDGSEFYHALILFASAFVHVQRGNAHGVAAQLDKARRALEAYRPHYLGVDVEELLEEAARWAAIARAEAPEAWRGAREPPRFELRRDLVDGREPELRRAGEPAPPGRPEPEPRGPRTPSPPGEEPTASEA